MQRLQMRTAGSGALMSKALMRSPCVREPARIARLFGVEEPGRQPIAGHQLADLLLAEAPRVARAVPVEVRDHRGLAAELLVPEALDEIPVDEALDVVVAALDAERRNIRRVEAHVERAQAPAKLGELLRH